LFPLECYVCKAKRRVQLHAIEYVWAVDPQVGMNRGTTQWRFQAWRSEYKCRYVPVHLSPRPFSDDRRNYPVLRWMWETSLYTARNLGAWHNIIS
jgi:hypothetical protein